MNIIDHTSDDIRQIVPADMSFLSDADQQITEALHHILGALLGGSGTETIVLGGCTVTSQPTADADITLRTLSPGILLHGGRIYHTPGGTWEEYELHAGATYQTGLGATVAGGIISFSAAIAAPSPVYGQSLQLDQQPHRQLSAAIVQSTKTLRFSAFQFQEEWTYDGQGLSDYIPVSDMKRLPVLGSLV